MSTHQKFPLISVHPETKKRLDKIGGKGDTYDTIIVRLLNGRVRRPLKERHIEIKKKAQRVIGTAVTAAGQIVR
ncbi:MAG: hypothetical protein MUP81_06335 [Dehalococcoidia bacterium]|nr:hypothetical protein [Dehalococcoidia bacterium]